MERLPLIVSGEPWVWPDGTPVRRWGPCGSRADHARHYWRAEDQSPAWDVIECPGWPKPPTREERHRAWAWDLHVEEALEVAR